MLREMLAIRPGITAVIGGGGKTSLLLALSEELKRSATVILATTTRIYPMPGMKNLTGSELLRITDALRCENVACVGTTAAEGKLAAPQIPFSVLASMADYVLVEADGSKHLPVKAHLPNEPVIPPGSTQVICVMGLSAIGIPVSECAHRPALYAHLAGCSIQAPVTPSLAAAVIEREGLHDRVFLNQGDTAERMAMARALAGALACPVCAGSLQKGTYICL
jgi:probable selenium-dependent hydroxylase accessory protein YqeC